MSALVLLKLGGSLITDKTQPYTVRAEVLSRLAAELARALGANPRMRLVLGHGSGSFGHTAAQEFKTREGLPSPTPGDRAGASAYWRGFAEVWFQASRLNRLVMEALREAGIAAVALAPVSSVVARERQAMTWDLLPLKAALQAGLIPVVYGDVVFDTDRGGTILSTEDLFAFLARHLQPGRILLAGQEPAVWADFPARTRRIERITPEGFAEIGHGVGQAAGADVTGGMQAKVGGMLDLVREVPGLTAQIFSGAQPGNLERALAGETVGTVISG